MLSSAQYILAIDQGTTGSTVSIIDHNGQLVISHSQDFEQIFPQPGWVEHNPEVIWQSVIACLKVCLEKFSGSKSQIVGIGITNQRETVVVWDRNTGAPVHNAIVWQCRRTEPQCQKLRKSSLAKSIRKKTGLVVDPYFSASKIQWILNNVPETRAKAKKGLLVAGTMDSYLLWRLSSGQSFATDVTNASRTMLYNVHKMDWDDSLLKIFSIPRSMLASVQASASVFGATAGLGILPDGIPITGMIGDQQSALFGQCVFKKGEAKCTFGTGSFMLMNTGSKAVSSKAGMLTTIAWQLPNSEPIYALEGGAFVCGAAVQWLRDGLGIIKKAADIEGLAKQVDSTAGVEFVPALTGLGAPHWSANARGMIIGMTRGTSSAHLARATLEAMALQNADILRAMQKDSGKRLSRLKVDGGAAANNLLMQLQADYLGAEVLRPKNLESTTMGAAYMAGIGVGLWKDISEIEKLWKLDQAFDSKMSNKARQLRFQTWNRAVEACKEYAEK